MSDLEDPFIREQIVLDVKYEASCNGGEDEVVYVHIAENVRHHYSAHMIFVRDGQPYLRVLKAHWPRKPLPTANSQQPTANPPDVIVPGNPTSRAPGA